MASTKQTGRQIRDESITRDDLCSTVTGKSVIKKLIAGNGIELVSSGNDPGTGDVVINVSATSLLKQYIHEQLIPSDTWVLYHEFEAYPEVVIIDTNGERLYCDLFYLTPNLINAVFSSPITGKAILSISKFGQTEFNQVTPSTTWSICHNLGRYPDVITFDTSSDNLRIFGDILYPSLDTVIVSFSNPMSGKIYLV